MWGRGIRRIPEGSHIGDGAACPAGVSIRAIPAGAFSASVGNCWSRISEELLTCPAALPVPPPGIALAQRPLVGVPFVVVLEVGTVVGAASPFAPPLIAAAGVVRSGIARGADCW